MNQRIAQLIGYQLFINKQNTNANTSRYRQSKTKSIKFN